MTDDHVDALRGDSRVTCHDASVFRDNRRATSDNVGVLEITTELERAVSATLRIIAE
jgi:hypothetical protein